MPKLIVFLLLTLSISCITKQSKMEGTGELAPELWDDFGVNSEPYEVKFQVETVADNQYQLLTSIELEEGSFFLSPYSSDKYSGRFAISLEDNLHLKMDNNFVETPRTIEEFDAHPFINGLVNRVEETTSYQYPLNLLSKDDFEVIGNLQFVIEPRCTMEKVKFMVSRNDGEMSVKKLE